MPIREARGIVCTVPLDEELKILTEARADVHRIVERLKLLYGMQPKFGDKEYYARMAAAGAGGFLFDLIGEVERRLEEKRQAFSDSVPSPGFGVSPDGDQMVIKGRIEELSMIHEAQRDDEEVILLGAARNGDDGQDRPGDAPERW
jgi:hypothetical protein